VALASSHLVDGVLGTIELHRTDLVWPLLRLWTTVRPESPQAWTMTGWAHKVDGRPEPATKYLRRALSLDKDNHDAAMILSSIPEPRGRVDRVRNRRPPRQSTHADDTV
jgi:Tetratricopeptide repeat